MSDVKGCVTNCSALSPARIDRQSSDDDTCSTAIFWGAFVSLRSVIFPRAPSRCCSGSICRLRSYFVIENASRSREKQELAPQRTQRAQSKQKKIVRGNFILFPMGPASRGVVSPSHTTPPRPQPTHLATAPSLASGSTPES